MSANTGYEWIYLEGKPLMVACKNVAPLVNCHFARATYFTEQLMRAVFKSYYECREYSQEVKE